MNNHCPSSEKLAKARSSVLQGLNDSCGIELAHIKLAQCLDEYFKDRLAEAGEPCFSFSLVAVGGYGRGEVCPSSDVDVLLLVRDADEGEIAELANKLFHPIWDLGLELGHGVRTVSECLDLGLRDFKVLASLLDARFLAGDKDFFQEFSARVDQALEQGKAEFVEFLAGDHESRKKSLGHGAWLIEPDLKNSAGGLRDYHQVRWLARMISGKPWPCPAGILDVDDIELIGRDADWLLRVRTALHSVAGRKKNQLFLEVLPMAGAVLFPDISKGEAGERLLARTHQSMARILAARRALFDAFHGTGPEPDELEEVPSLSEQALHVAGGGVAGWRLWRGFETRGEEYFSILGQEDRLDFLCELLLLPHASDALVLLFQTGAMTGLVPEMKGIAHYVQYDGVHSHPGGIHTSLTVAGVRRFLADEGQGFLTKRTGQCPALLLAALFHDIGKGMGPGDHCDTGANITRKVLERMGADKNLADEVEFLVRNHLLLFKASGRLDTGDEIQMSKVASSIGSAGRLERLDLLARADARATGEKGWSPWFRAMLSDIVFKLNRLLTKGPMAAPGAPQEILRARDATRSMLAYLDSKTLERILDLLPARYFLMRDDCDREKDLRLLLEMEKKWEKDLITRPSGTAGRGLTAMDPREHEKTGGFELVFAAPDQAGLFSTIAGVLSLHGLNVLSADAYTLRQGRVLDVFLVDRPADIMYLSELWGRITGSVRYAMTGKLALDWRIAKKRASLLLGNKKAVDSSVSVSLDNELSAFTTLVDISAPDRPGLLYDISKTIDNLTLVTVQARIDTRAGRARDVVHVKTGDGEKVDSPEQAREIKNALKHVLSS